MIFCRFTSKIPLNSIGCGFEEMIKKDPKITAPQIAMELGISTRGVEKNLRQLRESGSLKRIGSPTFGGYWEIVNLDND